MKRGMIDMLIFFAIFISIYGGMHFYLYSKLRAALSPGRLHSIAIWFFFLIMIFGPVIIRQAEKLGYDGFAQCVSFIGYSWLGFLFLFVSIAGMTDLYKLIVHLSETVLKKELALYIPAKTFSFYFPLILSVCISGYGFFEAVNWKTERFTIETDKLPKEINRIRIAQISDVHIGLIVREKRIKRILELIKVEAPDILVSTGDLVDGQIDNITGVEKLLSGYNPKFGKFAVNGNHEFYAGLKEAMEFTRNSGFKILNGEFADVAGIRLAGVDDPQGKSFGMFRSPEETELLNKMPRDKFTVLLKHRPTVKKEAIGLFDLQLSGHVHRGQIFPFMLLTRIAFKYMNGLYELPGGAKIYASRGTGTWGPPIRFLSPPEVTIIDIVPKQSF